MVSVLSSPKEETVKQLIVLKEYKRPYNLNSFREAFRKRAMASRRKACDAIRERGEQKVEAKSEKGEAS